MTSRPSTCSYSYDAFVTKFNFAGSGLVWYTFMGGTGNEIAQVQVDVARDILDAIGWNGNRVEMFRMFSAEPERFTRAVQEMTERANELGPTPVHKGTAGKWMEVAP